MYFQRKQLINKLCRLDSFSKPKKLTVQCYIKTLKIFLTHVFRFFCIYTVYIYFWGRGGATF